jgi:hypothetical protein
LRFFVRSKTLWCQGLLVSGPKLSLAAASSGGFEDRIQLLPQTSTSLTTLVSGSLTTDATVDVWVQMFDDEATQTGGYGCLGSLVLRVRDQLTTRAAAATPIAFGTYMSLLEARVRRLIYTELTRRGTCFVGPQTTGHGCRSC